MNDSKFEIFLRCCLLNKTSFIGWLQKAKASGVASLYLQLGVVLYIIKEGLVEPSGCCCSIPSPPELAKQRVGSLLARQGVWGLSEPPKGLLGLSALP